MAVVEGLYYTDPFCPWSWALEPALRRLEWELGGALRCGLARPAAAAELWRMATEWQVKPERRTGELWTLA